MYNHNRIITMRQSERPIIPGSNRHLMQLAMEKSTPPKATLSQRVTNLESFRDQLGSVTELKSRLENIEHMLFSPTPSTNIKKL